MYTQPITVGIDDGGKYVGIAVVNNSNNDVLYQEELTVRDDIKSKIDTRHVYRRSRRNRKTRYRQARFLNRKRKEGWLPPSIKSKKDSIIQTIKKLPLPVPSLIRLEDAYFDFQKLENPDIRGKEYQEGNLLYEKNYKSACKTRDGYKCRVCNTSENLRVHHIVYKSNGGSDKLSNLMTLCEQCHSKHHQEGLKLPKQKFSFYKYIAHVQQGKNYLQSELKKICNNNLELTFGYITSYNRNTNNVEKSHVNDAVIIANKSSIPLNYYIKTVCLEFRKRSLHEATPRKGIKTPNTTQKRNSKNTFKCKGFQRLDTVSVFGKIGFIKSFSGGNYKCRVVDINGKYIIKQNKKSNEISLSEVTKIKSNQGRIKQLINTM